MSLVLDDLLKNFLKSGTHELQHNRFEQAKEKLVLGLLELDVKVLNININFVDLEEVLLVRLLSRRRLDLEAESGSTKEDVCDTLVGQLRATLLSLDVVSNISQIHLNARNRQGDCIVVLVGDLLTTVTEVVVYS